MLRFLSKIATLARGRRSRLQDRVLLLGLDIPIGMRPDMDLAEEADLARRLASMPLFVRETYLLRTVDNMSVQEISERLSISPRATRRHMRRAIAMLAVQPEA